MNGKLQKLSRYETFKINVQAHVECLYPLLRRWWIDIKYWMDEDYKED